MEKSKREKLALCALYPVIALEIAFYVVAVVSLFSKRDILTECLIWKGSWVWIPLSLIFIAFDVLAATQGLYVARGRRPPLCRNKSYWAESEAVFRKEWLLNTWIVVIGNGAMLVADFAVEAGAAVGLSVIILMGASVVARRVMRKKVRELHKTDLEQR